MRKLRAKELGKIIELEITPQRSSFPQKLPRTSEEENLLEKRYTYPVMCNFTNKTK